MNFENIINEDLTIKSNNPKTDALYRKLLSEVFTPQYLKKVDSAFERSLKIKEMRRNNNVVAVTTGTTISINSKLYNSMESDRAVVYLIHETFHVLQNMPQFKELVSVNNALYKEIQKNIDKNKINEFLTGKPQNIHSDPKQECLSYFANNAFNWELCPELKDKLAYIITQCGYFNVNSNWWKKRLN